MQPLGLFTPPSGSPNSQPSPRVAARFLDYIRRHWRGDLSLGVSCWRSGLLATGIAISAQNTLDDADITRTPRLIAAGLAVLTVFCVAAGIWLLVGIWRSASRSIERSRDFGESVPWAGLIKYTAVFGVILLIVYTVVYGMPYAQANFRIALGYSPVPHHILRVLNRGSEIELSGGIDFGTSKDFRALLDATPKVRTIDLNSLGGRVAEAKRVRDLIRERHLATYAAAACDSACTIVYMGGYPRYLGPDGHLGFHRYAFPGLTPRHDDLLNREGEQYLIGAGVSPAFAARAFATPSTDLWVPDRATLLAANVITQEVNGLSFAAAAFLRRPLTLQRAAKILESVASFAALKKTDPNAFSQVVEQFLTDVQQGKSLREVLDEAKARMLAASAGRDERSVAGTHITRNMRRAFPPYTRSPTSTRAASPQAQSGGQP